MENFAELFGNRTVKLNNALKLFNKKKADLDQDVSILEEWLKTQTHLPEVPSINMITNILFLNKFSIEKSKENLDMYYTMRPMVPEVFQNNNPSLPHMKFAAKHVQCVAMPRLTPEGYRVIFIKLLKVNSEDFVPYDFSAHTYNIFEIRLLHDVLIGDIYVIDMSNYTFGHFTKLTPVVMKKLFTINEKVFKNLLKQMHFVNVTPYIENLVSIIKQVIKAKLAERLMVHKSAEDLNKYFPVEILPKEYGGEQYSLEELHESWLKTLDACQYRFEELDNLKIDESKRPAPLLNDDFLGFHGNFKQLSVD